jgi:hypothetical protein
VYGQGLSLAQARWVFDYQAVRGINLFQAMEYLSSAAEFRLYFHPPDWPAGPLWSYFPALSTYVSRVCALLSLGRPSAKVALYFPTTSGWSGDFEPDAETWRVARQLTEAQRDFDFVDEDALRSGLKLDGTRMVNGSGQRYEAIIVPRVSFLSTEAVRKLIAFQNAGGVVVHLNGGPRWVADNSYRDATTPVRVTESTTLGRLPPSDVRLSPGAPGVKVLHRSLADSAVYFFFNEGEAEVRVDASVEGSGTRVERWNPESAKRCEVRGERKGSHVLFPLRLRPQETGIFVISSSFVKIAVCAESNFETLATLDGAWNVEVGGRTFTSELRPWSDLGLAAYWGTATYRRTFELPRTKGDTYIDLGEVRYAARVRLNGSDLGTRCWRPYLWDLSSVLKDGMNVVEIEVANTRANELADPETYRRIDAKGWLRNSYVNTYLKFDREMVSSGLIGPVRVLGTSR